MKKEKIFSLLLVFAMLLTLLCACGEEEDLPDWEKDFEVRIFDTGKSDCILLTLGDAHILIDAADADDYVNISNELLFLGVETVDALILTHFDKDHIGSVKELVEHFKITEILAPDYESTLSEYVKMKKAIDKHGVKFTKLKEDKSLKFGGADINISVPVTDTYSLEGDDNNMSLIVSLEYEGHGLAFLGDAMKTRTEDFMRSDKGKYEFYKLPHHGDCNKALLTVLKRSGAKYAAICTDDMRNVEPELCNALTEYGIETYFTCNGYILLRIEKGELKIIQ